MANQKVSAMSCRGQQRSQRWLQDHKYGKKIRSGYNQVLLGTCGWERKAREDDDCLQYLGRTQPDGAFHLMGYDSQLIWNINWPFYLSGDTPKKTGIMGKVTASKW